MKMVDDGVVVERDRAVFSEKSAKGGREGDTIHTQERPRRCTSNTDMQSYTTWEEDDVGDGIIAEE